MAETWLHHFWRGVSDMGKWLGSPQFLKFEVSGGVARIALNRPEKRNAIHAGAGQDFCAGYDLNSYAAPQQDFDPELYRGRERFDDDLWHLRLSSEMRVLFFDMFKPVIARVQGNCLAGGTDLALMCDVVIAASDAKIGFPATRALGSPANHMWLYHVGPQWAKRLLMTGDSIRGRDAARIGLVLKAVAPGKLDAEVDDLARRLAAVDPELLAAHKRIVNLGLELMGARTLQRLASENDGRAHLTRAFETFFSNTKELGLKEALKRRDAPFGDGEIRLDD
jgi:enoyl-CoA hydratase